MVAILALVAILLYVVDILRCRTEKPCLQCRLFNRCFAWWLKTRRDRQ